MAIFHQILEILYYLNREHLLRTIQKFRNFNAMCMPVLLDGDLPRLMEASLTWLQCDNDVEIIVKERIVWSIRLVVVIQELIGPTLGSSPK